MRHWEIWYVYACYLSQDNPDLPVAAEKLLQAKFGRAVLLPSGELGIRGKGATHWEDLSEKDSINAAETAIQLPKNLPPDLLEPLSRTAAMRSASRNVFSCDAPSSDASLEVILPDLVVYLSENLRVSLEVTTKLYESGLVLISFHSHCKTQGTPLDQFISDHINLPHRRLHGIESDRDLSFLTIDASIRDEGSPIGSRRLNLKLRSRVREHMIEQSATAEKNNAQALPSDRLWLPGCDTSQLSGLALGYAAGLAYSLGTPRSALPYLILGEPREPQSIGFWSGTPHVHLLEFNDQAASAAENEERHGGAFKWILARTEPRDKLRLRTQLPKNTRAFDDFAVYVNEALVLWAYTTETQLPESGEGTQENPLYLQTLHHQVKGNLLEYGLILRKSFLHEIEQQDLDWDRIFAIKERQIRFDLDLLETGRYGEVRDTLAEAFRARKVDEIKEQTAALLSLRESSASVMESRRLAITGMILACGLGLLGFPGAIDFLNTYIVPHVDKLQKLDKTSLARTGILTLAAASVFGVSLTVVLIFRRIRLISIKSRVRRK